jgi:hypothetical protein
VSGELGRLLDRVEIPGEHEARERAWHVASAAYAERERVPRPRRHLRPALALAAAAALAAVAFTPPGQAVVDAVREAIGVESAEEALFSLPAPGRLLVASDAGAWAVAQDGSKRRLGNYAQAACSPLGRFVAVARANELAALEPDGDVRWKLARPGARSPRWGGTTTDTRIAYVSGGTVRVVAGDGTGDGPLAPGRAVAWRPGSMRLLAVATPDGVGVFDASSGRRVWRAAVRARGLDWSADGTRLLALTEGGYALLSASGRVLERGAATAAAFGPRGHAVAFVRPTRDGSELVVRGRSRFHGTGTFGAVAWSPDGRWLALAWPDADQLVFVSSAGPRRIEAASNLAGQFESATAPRLEAWCAAPSS